MTHSGSPTASGVWELKECLCKASRVRALLLYLFGSSHTWRQDTEIYVASVWPNAATFMSLCSLLFLKKLFSNYFCYFVANAFLSPPLHSSHFPSLSLQSFLCNIWGGGGGVCFFCFGFFLTLRFTLELLVCAATKLVFKITEQILLALLSWTCPSCKVKETCLH